MDMITVGVTDIDPVEPGAPVVLWGDAKVDEVAAHSGTIGYELMTRLTGRVPNTMYHRERRPPTTIEPEKFTLNEQINNQDALLCAIDLGSNSFHLIIAKSTLVNCARCTPLPKGSAWETSAQATLSPAAITGVECSSASNN